jgi:hypothetical protein
MVLLATVSIALASILLTLPLAAAYSGRDLVLPVAGHSAGADGRLFDTALWITNVSENTCDVTLSFYASGETNRAPRVVRLRIAAGQTWLRDGMDPALTGAAVMGAVRVQATQDVIATARAYSRMRDESNARAVASSFTAIPAQFAIGNGETTLLQGITPRDSRYKVYLVEVAGEPLTVTASLVDPGGRPIADKRLYVDAHMQLATDLHALFGDAAVPEHALLHLRGMNGDGRIVAAAAQISAESQDATAYEMMLVTAPRNFMTAGEVAAYSLAALAVLVAAFRKRGRPFAGGTRNVSS